MTTTVLAARLASLVPELAKDSLLNRERLIFGMLGELECEDKNRLDWMENPKSCYHICIDRQPDGYSILNTHPSDGSVRQAIDAAMNK